LPNNPSKLYLSTSSSLSNCIAGTTRVLQFTTNDIYGNLISSPNLGLIGLTTTPNLNNNPVINTSGTTISLTLSCNTIGTLFVKSGVDIYVNGVVSNL